jgi:radical SAM superfamily enzyme YgiQ (UPF0313 family)
MGIRRKEREGCGRFAALAPAGTPGLEDAVSPSRPRWGLLPSLRRGLMTAETAGTASAAGNCRCQDVGGDKGLLSSCGYRKKWRVALVSLNLPDCYNLANEYLRGFALEDPELAQRVAIHILNVPRPQNKYLLLARILALRPHAVGFSCYVWNIRRTLEVARLVKRCLPWTRVILGGQEVTLCQAEFLERYPFVDVVVNGEGEETFADLLKHWVKDPHGSLTGVPGLLCREQGVAVQTASRPLLGDLDRIPSPYLADRIPIRKGYRLGMMLEVYRGCRFRCAFCFEGKKYHQLRSFSLDRLEREVNHLFARGARLFHIMDPILGNQEPKNLAILHRIFTQLQEQERCEISVEVFGDLLNEQNIHYLEPFTIFDVGLQSTNPTVLKNIRRTYNQKKFLQGLALLKKLNRQINLYLIMGLPGETVESYLEGIRFAVGVEPSYLFLNRLCVLSGTELRERAEEYGLRYDPEAPYFIEATPDMTPSDIRRLESFSTALSAEHNLKIGR